MRTAIISDLHVGTIAGEDLARRPAVRARLVDSIAGADRVVVLGDMLEMREQRAVSVLEAAGPFLNDLGEATAGKQLVIVPGNHDHELVGPALDRARLRGAGTLGAEATFPADEGELMRRVAAQMPRTDIVLAYPGIRLRDDVYATHGHYLDRHLTVPRMECVLASAIAHFAGAAKNGSSPSADHYEAALAPIYAFAYNVVQDGEGKVVTRGAALTRNVFSRSNPTGRRSLSGIAVARLAIPGAVWGLNRLGLGPFRPDISPAELRRAGLRAMADVIRSLAIEAEHVIFGHTHRPGPLPGDAEGWLLPGGTRLTNTGSWLYEPVFIRGDGPSSPYWPGGVTWLADEGPPEATNVLGDMDLRPEGQA
ncbi:MAG TPA: metallophosphoesterase [Thermoleophilaceae bacterium]|nr:metallophosphoesterase [Thermoleophilaceae bacterium]